MSQKTARAIAKIIAILLVAALVVTTFAYVFGEESYAAEPTPTEVADQLALLAELMNLVQFYYKDQVSLQDLLDGAFSGTIDSLNDPFSVYFVSTEEGQEFLQSVSGTYSGVGLELTMDEKGQVSVVSVLPGSPALDAGMLAGDRILRVDGMDISGLTLTQVVLLIRGEAGTQVRVTVERSAQTLQFPLVRDEINQIAVESQMLSDGIGYIRIKSFDEDCVQEFTNAKLRLMAQGAAAFVIDVRDNPVGDVDSAVQIAGQFLPKVEVTHFSRKGEIVQTLSSDGYGVSGIPIVLLTNGNSASASEILAAAWKEHHAATLVGTQTYGKGIAQQLLEMQNGKYVKLSTFYFLTPRKNMIDGKGVAPDYVVENFSAAEQEALAALYASFVPMRESVKPAAGAEGLNVYGAQQRLQMLDYAYEVSGLMDEATVAAVTQFQRDSGLYPYGVLDYTTRDRLELEAAAAASGKVSTEDRQLAKALELLH
jgi:carboxyl-terminal processing protease